MNQIYDTIIVGAGPAGLSAALYAGRFRMQALLFEKLSVGGQILLSPIIENYPGFPDGIATDELIARFKQHVDALGIALVQEEVIELRPAEGNKNIYSLWTADAHSYMTKTVILATGAQSKRLGVPGEDELIGKGVSYCATCDGPLFRNKTVVVVGGGDRAIEEALLLSSYAQRVIVVHRRNQLRASRILEEKARGISHIDFVLESVVEKIDGDGRVEGVRIKNVRSGEIKQVPTDGVFIFVGIQPNTQFIKNSLEKDEQGFIITDHDMSTSQKGIFSCGDCRQKSLYQVISACSDGACAADAAYKYLLTQTK